ncbi:hypothetical protein OEA41_000180 [Lepraria neglecta]|uniref:Uncharacterized protein n=1 Tax=Lepraria neglecta TaxID=209136 RepID=A0AAE0DR81_9LECA|nr:hypothetical protein OEA41_000180 [Lepraria neglecta]
MNMMEFITEWLGKIFETLPNGILIHACTTEGAWVTGVARDFKELYPSAYHKCRAHCTGHPKGITLSQRQASLVSITLLTWLPEPSTASLEVGEQGKHQCIACLFTSVKNISKPEVILGNTLKALKDLTRQLERLKIGDPKPVPRELLDMRFEGMIDMTVRRPGHGDEGSGSGEAYSEEAGSRESDFGLADLFESYSLEATSKEADYGEAESRESDEAITPGEEAEVGADDIWDKEERSLESKLEAQADIENDGNGAGLIKRRKNGTLDGLLK